MEIAEMHDDTARRRGEADPGTNLDGLGARVFDRLHQMMCGLHGHDTMLQFEQDRMFLRCQSCGHETPGWDLNEAPPSITTAAAEEHRRPVARPHLISARRIA